MNTLTKRIASAVIASAFVLGSTGMGCNERQDAPGPNQCYSGKIVYRICPYWVFVQVDNAPIGAGGVSYGKTYDNLVALTLAEPAPADSLISFSIKKKITDYSEDCAGLTRNCNYNTNISIPKNIFCATNVSNQKCADNEK